MLSLTRSLRSLACLIVALVFPLALIILSPRAEAETVPEVPPQNQVETPVDPLQRLIERRRAARAQMDAIIQRQLELNAEIRALNQRVERLLGEKEPETAPNP